MAVELINGAEVRFRDKDDREKLGKAFIEWIATVEDDRRRLILEVYNRVQENLDGRSPVKAFPWYGASNAFAPLTGTYADAYQARLYEAGTAHDPAHLIMPRGAGDIIPEVVTREMWARWWQNISRWADREELDHKGIVEENTLTFVYFGDSWVYMPWEEQSIADIEILKGGKVRAVPRKLYAKPSPKVLHPKDVFIRWDARDHQLERLMGFQFDLDLPTLEEWEARGIYDEEVSEGLKKKLSGSPDDPENANRYFKQLGTRLYTPDEFESKKMDLMKVEQGSGNRSVKMLKMFARVDMDGDGIPEDTIFDVEKETGRVAYARYANYAHRERPLIHYWFKKRPGAAYNIGVGEMMLNMQDIINTAIRDHFDNNKIQNTSIFLIRKNSGIKQGRRVFPSATYWVNNPKEDFQALTLGGGARTSSLQEIGLLEKWGQFIVGLSDFQLGQEPKSRTPATTSSLSLEQATIRPKRIIEVMRNAMRKQHRQALMLYYQNGDSAKLAEVAAVEAEDKQLFIQAMDAVPPEAMSESLVIDPEVSSESFNRQARRQEAMALFAQLTGFWDRFQLLMQMVGGAAPTDPIAKELFLAQARGLVRAMRRILDTFEERDQREILPESLLKLLEGVTTVEVEAGGEGGEETQQPTPADAAQGLVTSEGPAAGPVAPQGRPIAGQPRVPAGPPQANGGDNG